MCKELCMSKDVFLWSVYCILIWKLFIDVLCCFHFLSLYLSLKITIAFCLPLNVSISVIVILYSDPLLFYLIYLIQVINRTSYIWAKGRNMIQMDSVGKFEFIVHCQVFGEYMGLTLWWVNLISFSLLPFLHQGMMLYFSCSWTVTLTCFECNPLLEVWFPLLPLFMANPTSPHYHLYSQMMNWIMD